jgi:hypothetical protein
MALERRWTLYLDESGQFSDASDAVAVAGLLVDEEAGGPSPREVEFGLKRMLPEFPWPLHASILNQASYVALAVASEGRRKGRRRVSAEGREADFVRLAEEASAWLETRDAAGVALVLGALEEGREPRYEVLRRLTRLLLDERKRWSLRLDGRTREAWAYVRDAAMKIAGTAERPCAYLVACSETRKGDAGAGEDDRYFGHLEALLQRVRALLGRREGSHFVSVRVLGRSVTEPVVAAPRPLLMADVERVIQRSVSDGGGAVRFRSEQVARFEATVGVHFVLADFFANQARRVLGDPAVGLAEAERSLVAELGAPARSGSPPRPHVAATGDAQRFLLAAPGDRVVLEAGAGCRRWAVEQALEWAGRA